MADRNELVAEALKDMFEELDGGLQVQVANRLSDAIAIATRDQPELVVLDAWIGISDAEHAVRQILECSPGSSVFVMASTVDPELERRVRRAGAIGCCEKERLPASAGEILDLIRSGR